MKAIRILLCDDHPIFREGVRATLAGESHVEIVAEAENGQQCLDMLAEIPVDVVFLDINMPIMDGIQCLQHLKKSFPETRVLALTQYDERRLVKQMMKFGADGYILKSTSRREMLLAISQVMKGAIYMADEAEAQVMGIADASTPDKLFPALSEREKEIIRLLCHEMSTKQIADSIFLSVHTVESHRSNIFKKIGVSNVAGLVRWAVNNDLD